MDLPKFRISIPLGTWTFALRSSRKTAFPFPVTCSTAVCAILKATLAGRKQTRKKSPEGTLQVRPETGFAASSRDYKTDPRNPPLGFRVFSRSSFLFRNRKVGLRHRSRGASVSLSATQDVSTPSRRERPQAPGCHQTGAGTHGSRPEPCRPEQRREGRGWTSHRAHR